MAIYQADIAEVEMNSGNMLRNFLTRRIGRADDDANRFGVRVFRDGQAEDLSGVTCKGYFTDSTGTRTTLTGTVSGNKAYVTLTDACYTNEGNFTLAIKLTTSSVITTVRIVDGVVDNTYV